MESLNKGSSPIAGVGEPYQFSDRHIGPDDHEIATMLKVVKAASLDALVDSAVPKSIRLQKPLNLPQAASEFDALRELKDMAKQNKICRSFIGMGYNDCVVPPVIQRNILENPGWYTQYTPYQAEIAQGRLEALLNFQTMVADLTGLPIANASLLDEGTAAAEAMVMCHSMRAHDTANKFFVADDCHPQTIAVIQTRAKPQDIQVVVGNHQTQKLDGQEFFGAILQYPATDGVIYDYKPLIEKLHAQGILAVLAADILSLALLRSPGELAADIAVGNTQRFGVPLGFGGPHAAYLATKDEYKRKIPGRLIGVSKDRAGRPALRLSLQTREQHIRRDKATSNICTAQVLLAIMASMYAVYHGPNGIKKIAEKVHKLSGIAAAGLKKLGYRIGDKPYFDTIRVTSDKVSADELMRQAAANAINIRKLDDKTIALSFDEATTREDLDLLLKVFAEAVKSSAPNVDDLAKNISSALPSNLHRDTPYLTHPLFNSYHTETKMLRYIRKLESRDLSLTRTMIPLGSCTMKLNATSELLPVSWPEFNHMHPFAPSDQTRGYALLTQSLEQMLAEITGFAGISLQPNAGSQGEYAGLLVIQQYHAKRGEGRRNVCLIPKSAHGTNPASAALAGLKVVVVECDNAGNIDIADLEKRAAEHAANLSSLMVTYPSTHGVFEEDIKRICEIVHQYGGQVYMDGANMNAQVGLCRPGDFGPDVCHLNLHKTFCIPHGGGGPGMGPIGVRSHLKPFLPGHPVVALGGKDAIGPVSAAPWGSASILPISWMYIRMMGANGLKRATEVAILNANYIAEKLHPHFPVLYRGIHGRVAHECIVDLRSFKAKAGIEVDDIAKRLMDYGFHAPTVSFPVPNTMMIEPTESEDLGELDRFCEAMIAIRHEIQEIIDGKADKAVNVLKNAPHTADMLVAAWDLPYSQEKAVFPAAWVRENKFWPHVGRVDNAFGDRNLVCTCLPIEAYQ